MKIVVLGGSGLIGKKTVEILRGHGHEVVPASTKSGVNVLTGEGLSQALQGAQVVVDVLNSPSFEAKAVMEFFTKSTTNVLDAASKAGVKHYLALSVVGTQRAKEGPYFLAKQVQENLVKEGKVPYTIVQATQFYEFMGGIADSGVGDDGKVHLSTGAMQAMAAGDVSSIVADFALGKPHNASLEIAGPERMRLCDFVVKYMQANHDKREVVMSADAAYFGMHVDDQLLVPSTNARLSPTKYEDWLCAAVK